MAERSSDQYVGFLVPFMANSADIWDAQSSYGQDGAKPADITPAERSKLRLTASGTSDGTTYVATTRRGGHISPGGAGFTWRKSTDASDGTADRGWDPPVLVTGWNPIAYTTTAVGDRRHPDRCVLPDGSILVCASVEGAADHTIKVWRITDGTTSSPVTVYTQSDTPTTRVDSHLSPSLAVLDDGTPILGHVVEDSSGEEAQWRVYRSIDAGTTWTEIASAALPEPVNIDNSVSGTGFTLRRARMRHNRGYTILLFDLIANNTGLTSRYAYKQYSSTSDGTTFTLTETMSEAAGNNVNFGFPDVTVYQGGFAVSWIKSTDDLYVARLSDSNDPISGAEQFIHDPAEVVAVVTSNYFSAGNTSLWTAPDGALYLAWRDTGSGSECRVARATALVGESTSFSTLGEGLATGGGGAAWWNAGTTNLFPGEFVGVAALGRHSIFAHVETATTSTYRGSLFELQLGGWSNVNHPGLNAFSPETRRAGWSHSGVPVELPGNTVFTKTAGGTHTEGLVGGILQADTSSSTLHYNVAPITTVAQGMIGEIAVQMNSGTVVTTSMRSGMRMAIEDASEGYEVQVRVGLGPDRIALYDGVSGGIIGSAQSVDWSNVVEIRVEMRDSGAQAWWRYRDLASDREWTALASTSSLTDSGGGGTSVFRFGPALVSQTVESDWFGWHYSEGDEAGTRTVPITTPDDLNARDYAGLGGAVYVEGNLLTATAGPGKQGESTTIAPKYDEERGDISNALYETASPRKTWRTVPTSPITTNTTLQTIAFQTGPSGEESYPPTEIIGAHFARPTFCTGAIQRKDTSSGWVDVGTFDICTETQFTGTRYGQTVRPTSGSSGRWVDRDELRGGWLRMGNSAPYTWRKVRRHSPGLLAAPSSDLAVVIEFEDADGTEPSGSVLMAVIPPEATVLVHTAGETAEGLRIVIDGQNCPEGAVEAGCAWLGYVVVPGKRWENGDRTALVSGSVRVEGDDRVDYAREIAPERREMEVGWTATNVVAPLMGGTADPDHALGSALSGARPLNSPSAAPGDVVGLVRRCRGALVPVVVLPRVVKLTGSGHKQLIWRRDEQLRARFDGNVSVRHIVGNEGDPGDGVSYRVESVPVVEIV